MDNEVLSELDVTREEALYRIDDFIGTAMFRYAISVGFGDKVPSLLAVISFLNDIEIKYFNKYLLIVSDAIHKDLKDRITFLYNNHDEVRKWQI